MEFLINFKTIMEAHFMLSLSQVLIPKHWVLIPVSDTATATKNLTI